MKLLPVNSSHNVLTSVAAPEPAQSLIGPTSAEHSAWRLLTLIPQNDCRETEYRHRLQTITFLSSYYLDEVAATSKLPDILAEYASILTVCLSS